MAHRITGEDYPEAFDRNALVQLMMQREMKFVAGIDYGYTHNFAVPLMAVDGTRAFVFGAWSQAELDPAQKIELLDSKIKAFDPTIYADTEAPDMNKLLKKKGYRVKDWSKTPGSVIGGIEIVRYKLAPSIGDPELFFLKGDEGCEFFFKRLSQYHWAVDAAGKPSDIPDDTDDDECDAIRYPIMNLFKVKGRVMAANETEERRPTLAAAFNGGGSVPQGIYTPANWAKQVMQEYLQPGTAPGADDNVGEVAKGKKGGFIWDL